MNKLIETPYMDLALDEAKKAFMIDEVPVGAVISYKNMPLASSHNLLRSNTDPTAHAEILVIRQAAQNLKSSYLNECDIYVTLEPCPMCAQAISFAKIRSLYFGAYDIKYGGVENGPCIFNSSSSHYKPQIFGGIKENESQQLLSKFFAKKR